MKFFYSSIIIIFTILYTNSAFATEIKTKEVPIEYNTNKNISQSKLIKKEATKFWNKLKIIENTYALSGDKVIQKSLKDLEEIIYILGKIETTKIHKTTADHVIKVVINDLKEINIETKSHIRTLQEKLKKERVKYDNLALKFSLHLNTITNALAKYYSKKKEVSNKEKEILLKIQALQKKSNQLKNFSSIKFVNKSELKASLLRILKGVKEDIISIKRITKK